MGRELMPFTSQLQRRKLHAMAGRGEIPKRTVDEFERTTRRPLSKRAMNPRQDQGLLRPPPRDLD